MILLETNIVLHTGLEKQFMLVLLCYLRIVAVHLSQTRRLYPSESGPFYTRHSTSSTNELYFDFAVNFVGFADHSIIQEM